MSLEFVVNQDIWFNSETRMADIILPANTLMEVDDIVTNVRQGTPQPNIMLQDKAIEPIGESKSDFEIVAEVAERFGLKEKKMPSAKHKRILTVDA